MEIKYMSGQMKPVWIIDYFSLVDSQIAPAVFATEFHVESVCVKKFSCSVNKQTVTNCFCVFIYLIVEMAMNMSSLPCSIFLLFLLLTLPAAHALLLRGRSIQLRAGVNATSIVYQKRLGQMHIGNGNPATGSIEVYAVATTFSFVTSQPLPGP